MGHRNLGKGIATKINDLDFTTIEDILSKLQPSNLCEALATVHAYYLNTKEKEYYQLLLLNVQGKVQRDIGILLNTKQYNICKHLSKLKRKIKKIIVTLTHRQDALREFLNEIKNILTATQYLAVSLFLAGNKRYQVAQILHCTPARISIIFQQLRKRLTASQCSAFDRYAVYLG